MSIKLIIEHLDEFLMPPEFIRVDTTWNRKIGPFIDVIDIQSSKSGDQITLNAGVFHLGVYRPCWMTEVGAIVQEPECIVRARIGELVNKQDLWWDLNEAGTANDVSEKLRDYILPFLARMHTFEAMGKFLEAAQVLKKRYPPPVMYLAVIKSMLGDNAGACSILSDFQPKVLGEWRHKIQDLAKRLKCKSTEA